ncbi:protein TIFY 11d [Euphorbia lathyris]
MANRLSGKASPEKSSNFAQTCNLLSQYLKERGSNLCDISRKLEPTGQEAPRTTLNLLPNTDNSKSMDLFPQFVADDLRKTTPPQMTIFYAGKVIVFDDIPAEKAKEIMAFANTAPAQELNFLDLPIARRASLQRFFEKRRDRVTARAPYLIQGSGSRSRSRSRAGKGEESCPWIDLEEAKLSSRQLELKL